MREAELWNRLNQVLGDDYAPSWASHVVLTELSGMTVQQALVAGRDCKLIWRAVWRQLELPESLR
ncbi:MAG: hypothetical protein CSA64_00820 [Arachnia propionica]|nr:MAG: hypothetical protein CSA64_00820 [Arachnia propionica]